MCVVCVCMAVCAGGRGGCPCPAPASTSSSGGGGCAGAAPGRREARLRASATSWKGNKSGPRPGRRQWGQSGLSLLQARPPALSIVWLGPRQGMLVFPGRGLPARAPLWQVRGRWAKAPQIPPPCGQSLQGLALPCPGDCLAGVFAAGRDRPAPALWTPRLERGLYGVPSLSRVPGAWCWEPLPWTQQWWHMWAQGEGTRACGGAFPGHKLGFPAKPWLHRRRWSQALRAARSWLVAVPRLVHMYLCDMHVSGPWLLGQGVPILRSVQDLRDPRCGGGWGVEWPHSRGAIP